MKRLGNVLSAMQGVLAKLSGGVSNQKEADKQKREADERPPLPPLAINLSAELSEPEAEKAERKTRWERDHRQQVLLTWGTWLAFIAAAVYAGIAAYQVRENRRALIISERPYMMVAKHKRMDTILELPSEHQIFVNLWWVNYGKSPAVNATQVGEVFVGADAMEQADAYFAHLGDRPLTNKSLIYTFPPTVPADIEHDTQFSTLKSSQTLNDDQLKAIEPLKFGFVVASRMEYYDMFGNRYWTDSCVSHFPNGTMPHCPKHNEVH